MNILSKDLERLCVLNFTQALAGPFTAQQLALPGADVIKIKPAAGGDQMRIGYLPAPMLLPAWHRPS